MPLIQVTIIEGRDAEAKRKLMTSIADAVETSLEAPRQAIRVIIQEVPAFHWSVGGEPKGPPPDQT